MEPAHGTVCMFCWASGVCIDKMYGHILSIFECICAVSEVNKAIQKGENTRTNQVSCCMTVIGQNLEY